MHNSRIIVENRHYCTIIERNEYSRYFDANPNEFTKLNNCSHESVVCIHYFDILLIVLKLNTYLCAQTGKALLFNRKKTRMNLLFHSIL